MARPRVAVVIPILNEAPTLPATLAAIAAQDYPAHLVEVLVIDGGSGDDWGGCVAVARDSGLNLRVLRNPRQSTSAAVNLGLHSTDAPKVLWISGHCVLSSNYLSRVVAAHSEWEGIVAGGRVTVKGAGVIGKLNALLLRSRFGTGLASWRHVRASGWVEIVNYALFDRQQLLAAGGLDERLGRNQDNDLFDRLRKAGIRCRLIDAEAEYHAPATLGGLLRRAWGNGAWAIWSSRLGRPTSQWFHLVPLYSVVTALVLLALGLFWRPAWYVLGGFLAVYCIMAVFAALDRSLRDRAIWALPLLPIWFALFHASYGIGTLAAVFRPVPRSRGERA